jgi:hypothetical protein
MSRLWSSSCFLKYRWFSITWLGSGNTVGSSVSGPFTQHGTSERHYRRTTRAQGERRVGQGACGGVEDCSRAEKVRRQNWRLIRLFLLAARSGCAEVLWFVEHVIELDELWYLLCVASRWRPPPCCRSQASAITTLKVDVVVCIPSALFFDWPSRNSLISMQLLILPPESVATG